MRVCEFCGAPLVGRADKRFCNSTCRMRNRQGRPATSVACAGDVDSSPFVAAVVRELRAEGALESVAGAQALALARALAAPRHIATGMAALSAEFSRAMDVAAPNRPRPGQRRLSGLPDYRDGGDE